MTEVQRIKSYPKGSETLRDAYGYNEGVREAWTPMWCRNAARGYHVIEGIFADRNADMSGFREKYTPGPSIILGSGPSQHDIRPYLKDWKGNLFISTSQLPLCAKLGIEPTACVLIDSDPRMVYLVKDYAKDFKNTVLITHPQVPREYFESWDRDRIYFFRMLDPGDEFSSKYLQFLYGWINETTNWAVRSTILNGGNIVNSCIPLVAMLNSGSTVKYPIFLAGYDLGYPDNLLRCSEIKRDAEGNWEELPPPPLTEERWTQATKQVSNNGVPLDDLGVFYKTSTMILLAMSNPPIISCSRGVLTEVPYVNPKEVVEKQGVGFDHLFRSEYESYRIGQAFLIPRGFLTLRTDFWVSVTNIRGIKKWWERWLRVIEFHWFNTRPWKWQGGRGWTPVRIKKLQRKTKRDQKKAEKAKEKVCSATAQS